MEAHCEGGQSLPQDVMPGCPIHKLYRMSLPEHIRSVLGVKRVDSDS
jgi:hypothetical protein